MAEKTLNTRILLKYDSYENWTTKNPVLKKGEVAIATVPSNQDGVQNAPSTLIKVGDGTSDYKTLKFVSGLAADVHTWAKAENKPTYEAKEITGIDTYIANYVNDQMGISVDTDTQYTIKAVEGNAYQYKLMSKSKLDTDYTVEVATIEIPKYDDTAVKADIQGLKDLVGTTAVATQIGNAISGLKAELVGASTDASSADTIYGAKKYAEEQAAAKVASVTAKDNSIDVSGTATAPVVGVKVSAAEGNLITLADDGLKVIAPAAVAYSIVKDESSSDYSAVYHLTADGVNTGAAINIPKDMVVQSGAVVTNPEGQAEGTYIELTLANATNDKIYVNVGNLIEYVTSGSATGDQIVVAVSDDHKVTATLSENSVTKAQLVEGVRASLNLADSALQKADITTGTTNGTILVEDKEVAVAGLGTAAYKNEGDFDAAGAAATVKSEVIGTAEDASTADTIYGAKKYAAEAVSPVAERVTTAEGEIDVLQTEIAKKANDADLAAIAKTGNVNDLVQTTGDVLIFDCGNATI